MTHFFTGWILFLSLSGQPESETLFVNATVVTLDESDPTAEAVLVVGDRIRVVGTEEECREAATVGVSVIDLGGRTLTRGFEDSHCHLMSGGQAQLGLDLSQCDSRQKFLDAVKAGVSKLDPGQWLIGRGFDQTLWRDHEWPHRGELDRITLLHPVFLKRVDGHSAVVNTCTLNLAGIDGDTVAPPGGVIERDRDGDPTGVLKESAVGLVSRLIPSSTFESKMKGARLALKEAAQLGITSCVDHGGDPEVYLALLRRGDLTCRISIWGNLDGNLDPWMRIRKRLEKDREWVSLETLKAFVDGTLGSRTAALFRPFADDAETRGVLRVDPAVLNERVTAADRQGFQVALHAIGDRAVSVALDAYQKALDRNGNEDRRHRVEHLQVVRAEDLQRMRDLGVVASVQPCHLLTDRRFAEIRLGPDRVGDSYRLRSLLDSGIPVAFGTDFPVESLDPRRNLFSATSRKSDTDERAPAWGEEEAIEFEEALRAQTVGGAFAAHREDDLGPLRAGTLADLVVLDSPVEGLSGRALLSVPVYLTMVGGETVFSRR